MNALARLGFAVGAALACAMAWADCRPAAEAWEKFTQQSRLAVYSVDRPDQPPALEPDTVFIGNSAWTRDGKTWERMEIADLDGLRRGLMKDLRAELARGAVRCSAAGSGSLRGAPVVKIRSQDAQGSKDSMATMWVDTRSGLPVFIDHGAEGGTYFRYGADVKEPKVGK